ncbi:MAG: DUF1822 family protein [Cyanosarcina radialis HA8281-LM2]|nr:DUF1822 family protein [Cyanosarcina radialis HA8281-LM2]
MKLSLTALKNLLSEHIWLEFSEADRERAKSATQNYSNETGRNNAFIDRLCLNALTAWMQDNLELEDSPSVFPDEASLASIWEVVNGTAIDLGSKRIVLIPSDAIDTEELAVPQEWVDIPNWAADYYLPVRVDLDNRYLHIWGFVSRQTLKAKSNYEPIYRSYHLDRYYLIEDLDVLWTSLDLCDEKGNVEKLPTLSNIEAKDLIEKLSKPSPYSPRLDAKFEQWGALLNDRRWLQELYERRLSLAIPTFSNRLVQLSSWLDGAIQTGWQNIEELLSIKPLTPEFRGKTVKGIQLETSEQIQKAIAQLYNSQTEVAFPANLKSEEALVHLLQNTNNETIRWQAAEYLWALDPHHPGIPARRVRNLGVQLKGNSVALMVGVMRKPNRQVAVLLRAYPMGDRNYVPPGLQLTGLDDNGTPIPRLEAVARKEPLDECIQLYFSADVGDRFGVRVALENATIAEHFMV